MRFNDDGTLDSTFSADGKVTTDFGSPEDAATSVVLDGNKIVVAGRSSGHFAVARYNNDGNLDTTFDDDGKVSNDFGGTAQGVAIDEVGRIVLAGSASGDFALARYNGNGDAGHQLRHRWFGYH